jgi:flagellar hook-associated protein 1 FlgK
LSDLLNIGRTGLNVSKKALETTGHNIANVNTEGYSRQRVNQQTNTPVNKGGIIHGTGANIKDVTRVHDPFIEKRLNSNISESEFFDNRSKELVLVENVFNEIDNDGLNKVLNKFFNSFRELANQPENETIRSLVRDNAELVVNDFHRISSTLDEISRGIDKKLEGEVEDINAILRNVASLNRKVAALEASGEETGDLRDQRDTAIRELSKSFKVHTYMDEKNSYVVSAQGVGTLVAGAEVQEIAAGPTTKSESTTGMDGTVELYFKSRPTVPLTSKFKGGVLTALAKVRNEDIRRVRDEVDRVAYEFSNAVNSVHNRGHVNRQVGVDAAGNALPFDAKGAVTGIDFFARPQMIEGAAKNLSLSQAIRDDLSNIVTGLEPNSPGDNRIAIAISKIQHERIMGEGTATLEESYLQTIGNVGLEVGKSNLDSEQANGILVQTQALRERTSGVSLDEEAANMVRFQHAYQASAKVMQTANEMFDTILSIKR